MTVNQENQVVVVTGAGKGIGRALVELLLHRRNRVLAVSRTQADLEELSRGSDRDSLVTCCADVRDTNKMETALSDCVQRWGRLDGLVNNAGIRQRLKFLDIDDVSWNDVIETNLSACFRWMRAVTPQMLKQGSGAIVNVASIVGERGFSQLSGYAAAKAGLVGLTQSYAVEFAEAGIRANVVCPGFAESSYATGFKSRRPELHDWTVTQIPMARWGTCEEVAEVIAFLVEPRSSYVTGAKLACDGGWLAGTASP